MVLKVRILKLKPEQVKLSLKLWANYFLSSSQIQVIDPWHSGLRGITPFSLSVVICDSPVHLFKWLLLL